MVGVYLPPTVPNFIIHILEKYFTWKLAHKVGGGMILNIIIGKWRGSDVAVPDPSISPDFFKDNQIFNFFYLQVKLGPSSNLLTFL